MKSQATIGRARALVRYFRDPAASFVGKLFVMLALVYVISPADAIPDVIPVIGWLDDIGVMGLAVAWMWRVVGRYRVAAGVPEGSVQGSAQGAALLL